MADTKKVIGKVSLTPKGSYDPAATYERLDVIRYDGRGYIVLAGITWADLESVELTWQWFEDNPTTWAEFESKFCVHARS